MNAEGMDVKRLEELALRAGRTGRPCFTKFVEPSAADAVRTAANRAGVRAGFWGGWPGAERCVAAFYTGEAPAPEEYPLQALRIAWNARFSSPGHRDLLGAVMGLGIEREAAGDIAMGTWRGADCAYLFVLPELADYVAANLESAGKTAVKVSVAGETPEIRPPEGIEMRVTVQAPRLDAVLAAGVRLSRGEAQKLIAAGLVKLNHVENTRADTRLEAGDLLSVRGHGRLRVQAFQGESRRGRLVVALFKYGNK